MSGRGPVRAYRGNEMNGKRTAQIRGLNLPLRRLIGDRRGVGAIEFAIVAPVLILLYVGSAEISVAMSINKKVARASSTIADLVSQRSCVTSAFLSTMPDVANSIMTPYNELTAKIKITEIHIGSSGTATVSWSRDQAGNSPYATSSTVTLPADLVVNDTDLVRTELSFVHHIMMPGASGLGISSMTLEKTYYLRPRQDGAVALQSSCS